jgi:hypothetical protein
MPITVFYCWQSDRDADICHYFIRDGLKDAIKRLKADVRVKAEAQVDEAPAFPDMVLDHDTKGVPGSPKVAEVIQRKIQACDVFVADMTHVAEFETQDGRRKKAQNGNVLVELGHALAQKRPERILLVMNTAFGSFDGLPFDLHLYRKPISYNVPDASDKATVKAEQRALVDRLVEALGLMLSEIGAAAEEEVRRVGAAKEAELRDKVKTKRQAFEGIVMSGGFAGVPNGPRLGVTIIPIRPPVTLDFGEVDRNGDVKLRPIGATGYNTDLYGRSLMRHNGVRARGGQPAEAPTTAVELNDQGAILAVVQLPIGASQHGRTRILHFENRERALYEGIAGYVRDLRRLGVSGPLEVGVLLSSVEATYLHPAEASAWDADRFRPLHHGTNFIGPVVLAENIDGQSVAVIAEAMRAAFTIIWREAGVPNDPCFQGGKYRTGSE